jgi:hypothetical protein
VLPVLFGQLATGAGTDLYWAALCRIDTWGDGAWYLEMEGAAFDAFSKNPSAFFNRYLAGDDCALLLLTYAYLWPLEGPEVGGISCKEHGKTELVRFDRAITAAREAATSAKRPNASASEERQGIMLNLITIYESAWATGRQSVEKACVDSK